MAYLRLFGVKPGGHSMAQLKNVVSGRAAAEVIYELPEADGDVLYIPLAAATVDSVQLPAGTTNVITRGGITAYMQLTESSAAEPAFPAGKSIGTMWIPVYAGFRVPDQGKLKLWLYSATAAVVDVVCYGDTL